MGSSDSTLERFSTIWEERDLDEKTEHADQTATIKPDAPSEGRAAEGMIEQLPRISQSGRGGELADVDIRATLGKGGMAYVLAANQVSLDREVAVKRLRADLDRKGNILPLLQEARITGKLEHPNIIPIYRLGRDDAGDPLIVMKRIEGMVWSRMIHDPSSAPRRFEGADPLDWHLDVLSEVCNAVHYAHDHGILHRDLKPENIMVGEFGEVYVLDWGLAATFEPDRYDDVPAVGETSEPTGTPGFMAPEMVTVDTGSIDGRTDVYLLGGLLYYVLTGRPPHQGESAFEVMFDAYRSEPREFPEDVDQEIAEICNRALHKDPDERYPSAEAFRHAILEYKQHRESLRLGARAEARLETFRESLEGGPGVGDAEIRQLFGECRFGFLQALEASSRNEAAREGLQEVLELMIEYELDREAYQSAELLLSELPESRPEFAARIEALRNRQESREQRYETLKEIETELDVDLGRHTRSILVLGLGALWAILGFGPAAFEWATGVPLGTGGYLFQAAIVAVALVGGIYLGRRALFQNEANRTLVAGLVLIFVAEFVVRVIGSQAGVPIETIMAQEMVMSAMGTGVLGVALDRRLFWAAVPYAVGAGAAALFPELVHPVNGITNIVAMGLLAWAWWPDDS